MDSAIRVFLVDDHPVVRVGLGALINKQKDLTVSGEVATGREVLSALSEYPTDVLVADLALADMNGLEVVKQVRGEYPDMPILVLSMHDERLFAERALRAGANGYIMKDTAPQDLMEAIRKVVRNEVTVSQRQSDIMVRRMFGQAGKVGDSPLAGLTDRELQVFELLGRGNQSRMIAKQLFISVKTVETHFAHIKKKLGLKTQVELLHYAFGWVNEIAS